MPLVPLPPTRTAAGQFAPGQSGNPGGRPKGARNRATLAAEALVADHAGDLTRRLVDAGLAGDARALTFLLGRVLPAAKERPITLEIEAGREGDFVHLHGLVLRAMAEGELTPAEALAASRVIAIGAKLVAAQQRLRSPRPSEEREGEEGSARSDDRRAPSAAPSRQPLSPAGRGARPLILPFPRWGEGPDGRRCAPVSRLYFSPASRAALCASTALGAGMDPAPLFPPVNPCAVSTRRAAA